MTKYICDRCGKDFDDKDDLFSFRFPTDERNIDRYNDLNSIPDKNYDICSICVKAVIQTLNPIQKLG